MTTQRRGKIVISNVVKASPIHVTDDVPSGVPNLLNNQPALTGQPQQPQPKPGAVTWLPGGAGAPGPPPAPAAPAPPAVTVQGPSLSSANLNSGGMAGGFAGAINAMLAAQASGAPPVAPPGGWPVIPINAPVPPTITLGQAQGAVAGAATWVPA